MPAWTIIGLLTLGVALVVGSLLLRVLSSGKHEIKTTDLVFLVLPLVVVALATGKLGNVEIFGLKADFSRLWMAVAQTEIKGQVAFATVKDAVHVMQRATKTGIEALPQLIKLKTEVLEFKLGYGFYKGSIIKAYFEALSGSSFLRVVVVNKPDDTLFGMYNAADLIGALRVDSEQRYEQFQKLLTSASEAKWEELAKWPGFVSARNAVTVTMSKRDTLARMEQLNTDSLPVVNEEQRFIGTVERAKLTTSLLLAVTDKLEGR